MKPLLSRRQFLASTALSGAALAAGGTCGRAADAVAPAVKLSNDRTVLDLSLNGKAFAVYNYSSDDAGLYRPYFHPLFGPKDQAITQNGEFPGTLRGHYWHRGLFVAHQKVNGVSFGRSAGPIAAESSICNSMNSPPERRGALSSVWPGVIWAAGTCSEKRGSFRCRAWTRSATRWTFPFSSVRLPVKLLSRRPHTISWPVGWPIRCAALRRSDSIRNATAGWSTLSRPDEAATFSIPKAQWMMRWRGARARWCDFSGPLRDGTVAGVAILDHPSNPRHPIPWHNWNNMTFTASLTYHEPLALKQGDELRLAFRVVVHAGRPEDARLEEAWKAFAQVKPLFA